MPVSVTEATIEESGINATLKFTPLKKTFRRQIKKQELPIHNYVYLEIKWQFKDDKIVMRNILKSEKKIQGKYYHLNLRLPSGEFNLDQNTKTWRHIDDKIAWNHSLDSDDIQFETIPGSDAPVQYARAFQEITDPIQIESQTEIIFR